MATNKVETASRTITAAGASAALAIHYQGSGLPPEVQISGTFSGTSAQVQWSIDGTIWHNIGTALTADGVVQINRLARQVRANLTGGTGINLTLLAAY